MWHGKVLALADGVSLEVLFKVVVAVPLVVVLQIRIVPQQQQELVVLVHVRHVLAVRGRVVRGVVLHIGQQLLPVVLRRIVHLALVHGWHQRGLELLQCHVVQ